MKAKYLDVTIFLQNLEKYFDLSYILMQHSSTYFEIFILKYFWRCFQFFQATLSGFVQSCLGGHVTVSVISVWL